MSTRISNSIETNSTRSSLELLYHISRELSSALDLRTVLERVLLLSMQNVGAINGSIIVLDDKGLPVDSVIIVGNAIQDHATKRLLETLEKGLSGWVVKHHEPAVVENTHADVRWMPRKYGEEEKQRPKSAVGVPIQIREKLVGVLTLVHPQVGFFTFDHVALLSAIADQAGVAVQNARLYAESLRSARVMTALAKSASGISASLNLDDVIDNILKQTEVALQVQVVALSLVDRRNNNLELKAVNALGQPQDIASHAAIESGISRWVADHDEAVMSQDVNNDPRFDPISDQYNRVATKSILAVPIHHQGKVIGSIEGINPIDIEFDQDSLLILSGIANLAGTAIQNAQLFEQLQEAQQNYQDLFEDSIDPILITDWEGKILEANRRAEIFSDCTKDELKSQSIGQLHQIDRECVGENFGSLRNGDMLSYESTLRSPAGHEVPIKVYAREIHLDNTSQLQWILRDITEQKSLDTLRDDLTSMIYHDLRSPLANVVSSMHLLDSMLPEDSTDMKSLLDISMRSTERIQRMTESLLEINVLQAGQTVGTPKPTNILVLVHEAAEAIESLLLSKSQIISYKLPGRVPNILVDQEMIKRVVINLLENASKYSPQGSKIEIGVRQVDDHIKVWVADHGPGIPAYAHERIFEKFTRLKSENAPKGLGLGLAYCRLAVQAHGGKIWVESEPGSGSRFSFILPFQKK